MKKFVLKNRSFYIIRCIRIVKKFLIALCLVSIGNGISRSEDIRLKCQFWRGGCCIRGRSDRSIPSQRCTYGNASI